MMLALDPKDLSLVKAILATYAKDKTVWAFGSRVQGTYHSGSDLDLVIMNSDDLSPEFITKLRTKFTESNLAILVDLLAWSEIPDYFKQEIKKNYVVLQAGN